MSIEYPYYVYRHIRPDTGQVFYVGKAKVYKKSSLARRAECNDSRNNLWQKIVDKNEGSFEPEVMVWCETNEEAIQKEKEFIALYGKIIDNTGTLSNMTDGGEGCVGYRHTPESREKMKNNWQNNPERKQRFLELKPKRVERLKILGWPNPMKGNKHTEETKLLMSSQRNGGKHPNAKKIIDTTNDKIYGCVRQAAEDRNINKWYLYAMLEGKNKNFTNMRYL